MPTATFDTVLINGSVGTGKTTTAEGLGAELERLGIPGAVIDVDGLRRSWPSPPGDPFRAELAIQNLRAVASNFRRAGARVLIVATVVETPDELEQYVAALAPDRLLHVRLAASHDAVRARLTTRHRDDDEALQWHVRRHPELAGVLERAGFDDDLLIDTTDASVAEVVGRIVSHITA